MFTIIGGDGKEYGPASADKIRAWIAAGRANLDTQARAAGSDEWRRLGDYAEFAPAGETPPILGTAPAGTAAPVAGIDDPNVAERWRRFLGALVDGLLESLCWMPSSIAVMHAMTEMASEGGFRPEEFMTAFWSSLGRSLPYLGALFLLQVVLLSVRSQSVGNILLRTRIVRVSDGQPGGFLRAFLLRGFLARLIRQVPFLGGIFWIVDSCFIFRDDRRCLHDLIAGTKVVKV